MSIVFSVLKKYWKWMILLILAACGVTLCIMGLPILMQELVDKAINGQDSDLAWKLTGIMLILAAVGMACGFASAKLAALIAMSVGRDLRGQLFVKVQGLSQAEIDKFTASSLITRTNSDIMQIQTFLTQCLNIALSAPIMAIVGVALAVRTSPALSETLIVAVPVLAIFVIIIGKIAIPLSAEIQKKLDHINLIIREKLTGTRVIRAFGTTGFEEKRFEEANHDYMKKNRKLQSVTAALMPSIYIIVAVTVGVIMLVAYQEEVDAPGAHTSGEILAIIEYIMYILMAVIYMTTVFLLMPRAVTSANRAKEVLESKSLITDALGEKVEPEQKGYLEFKNVSFTYAGADRPAIRGVNFQAVPGKTTAIIGGTGMGKSTIINLIPRLYDATEGEVLVDGVNVKDYKLADLRKKIGFVPQKAALFSGTIDSNISFGGDNPTADQVEAAIKTAQSYDFVMDKKDGFEAKVAQGGSNFSGGQKQRLCIARAIVREPEIYVFDDSFSALDFKTDKNLRTELKKQTKNATTIIVAQRINTIMDADQILVVDKGDVVGMGTHKELLKSCKVYQEIAKSQLSEEELKR